MSKGKKLKETRIPLQKDWAPGRWCGFICTVVCQTKSMQALSGRARAAGLLALALSSSCVCTAFDLSSLFYSFAVLYLLDVCAILKSHVVFCVETNDLSVWFARLNQWMFFALEMHAVNWSNRFQWMHYFKLYQSCKENKFVLRFLFCNLLVDVAVKRGKLKLR